MPNKEALNKKILKLSEKLNKRTTCKFSSPDRCPGKYQQVTYFFKRFTITTFTFLSFFWILLNFTKRSIRSISRKDQQSSANHPQFGDFDQVVHIIYIQLKFYFNSSCINTLIKFYTLGILLTKCKNLVELMPILKLITRK